MPPRVYSWTAIRYDSRACTDQDGHFLNMRKLLIFIIILATALSAGCGTLEDATDAIPNALDRAALARNRQ